MPFPVPGRLAEFLRRATVQIRSATSDAEGSGSGIVLQAGQIITNAHVTLGGALTVEAWDGSTYQARVVRKDSSIDLAVLTADTLDAPPAALAVHEPKPGAAVIAVGNPLGFVGAVSTGFVRAVSTIRGLGWRRWVQADVRLAPGNSGGPLADVTGQIVGINTMIAGGLALAIPAATVQRFLSAQSQRKLGVTTRPVMLRSPREATRPALLLLEIAAGGPAEHASLLPGDILLSANEKALQTPDDLSDALGGTGPVLFSFHRAGDAKVRRVTVELSSNSQATAA